LPRSVSPLIPSLHTLPPPPCYDFKLNREDIDTVSGILTHEHLPSCYGHNRYINQHVDTNFDVKRFSLPHQTEGNLYSLYYWHEQSDNLCVVVFDGAQNTTFLTNDISGNDTEDRDEWEYIGQFYLGYGSHITMVSTRTFEYAGRDAFRLTCATPTHTSTADCTMNGTYVELSTPYTKASNIVDVANLLLTLRGKMYDTQVNDRIKRCMHISSDLLVVSDVIHFMNVLTSQIAIREKTCVCWGTGSITFRKCLC
jgi:hypothetical protein